MKESSKILITQHHTWYITNFTSLDSTNTYLIQHSQNYRPFTCIVAQQQTSGHGKYGRAWHTMPKKDLSFSLLIPLHNIAKKFWNIVTQTTALAITKSIEDLKISPRIKWPNDVLVRGKKICGILCVKHSRINHLHEKEPMLIIGIGLNVNSTEKDLCIITQPATSIFIEHGTEYSKEKILAQVLHMMSKYLYELQKENFTTIRHEIEKRWYMQKKTITLAIGKEIHQGKVVCLNEDASLQFHCETCGVMRVYSGEFLHINQDR